jgi:hypothetical protein
VVTRPSDQVSVSRRSGQLVVYAGDPVARDIANVTQATCRPAVATGGDQASAAALSKRL